MRQMESVTDGVFFDEMIRTWWDELYLDLSVILEAHHTPVIIALSRKMPRFFEWFKKNYAHLEGVGLLDSIEISSELAIPFIFNYDSVVDKRFILADDVLIHGDSIIQSYIDFTVLLDDVDIDISEKQPKLSLIAVHENAEPIFKSLETSNQDEIDTIVDAVSNAVGDDLPIDFEFPIFVTKTPLDRLGLRHWIEESFMVTNGNGTYGNKKDHVRIIDSSRGLVCFNNNALQDNVPFDFFKCRFFGKEEVVSFEVFCPVLLSGYDLVERKQLFTNPVYQHLWNISTDKIKSHILDGDSSDDIMRSILLRKDYERSLCVWANYLFAISAYNKIIAPNIHNRLCPQYSLSRKELAWILGNHVCDIVWNPLQAIISNREVTEIAQVPSENVPDTYCPDEFKSMIESTKSRLVVESNSSTDILKEIFIAQHYTNPVFRNKSFRRVNIGETYESLISLIKPFTTTHQGKDDVVPEKDDVVSEKEIHNWIDANIDTCRIIPRYAKVDGDNGMSYWRRFFHAGIFSLQTFCPDDFGNTETE